MSCSAERNIRLLVAYDGTDFSGWQRQERSRTVQGLIEEALEKLHKKPVRLTASGRTDAGVHAAAQVANFYTSIGSMEAARFVPALNSLLPKDIRILEAKETLHDFHARFDVRMRTYRYYFITRRHALPWEQRFAWHIRRQPEIQRLNAYARLFHGEMDCTAFSVPKDKSRSRSRYIFAASFFTEGDKLVFEISANAFLWKMVRSIAGTLMRLEEEKAELDYLRELIQSKKRSLSGPTAPPQGLFLWKVDYYRDV
jgi:tRNA pseudouridine38-40 synthase